MNLSTTQAIPVTRGDGFPGRTTQSASRRPFYRPELDAVRFFAFLGVFCSHVHSIHNRIWVVAGITMRFCVPLFFCLSSFLITDLLRRETEKTGSVHLKQFYLRRVLRIWPLYFLIIVIGTVAGLLYAPWAVTGRWLASALLMWNNYLFILYGIPLNPFLGPVWSISVEEQFYVLVPGLTKIGGQKIMNLFSGCVILAAYVYLWKRGLAQGPHLMYDSLNDFQFFAAGTLLANFLKGKVPSFSIPIRLLIFASGLGLWLFANRVGVEISYSTRATHWAPVYGWASVLVGTVLIFLAFLGVSDILKIHKSILYLGTISYGLYIYHRGIIALIEMAMRPILNRPGVSLAAGFLSLAVTVAVAAASYRWIETPFILLKKRFELVRSRA